MPHLTALVKDAWIAEFRDAKKKIDAALAQLSDEQFFQRPAPNINAVAHIIKHLAGNMRSRWTDFLTTDGEKPDRNRESEFSITTETRADLVRRYEEGWRLVFATVQTLTTDDLQRTITIRGEPIPVPAAVTRQVAHYAYHAGQVLMIARTLIGNERWQWQTIPPGGSDDFNREMMARFGGSADRAAP